MRRRPAHAKRSPRGGRARDAAVLWAGTIAFGFSTVALLAVLSRHSTTQGFSDVAALLSLAFVVSLVPSGIQLRSAALVADGRPPPMLSRQGVAVVTLVSLAISPILALLLRIPVAASAIVTVQMVVAIPLAARQGALIGRHRFDKLGWNLFAEGGTRFALGALLGLALGVTGLALGLCAGTIVALVLIPRWRSDVTQEDRPRTSLTATSASLALLGLFVQLDVLVAPSALGKTGAAAYDLAAVPSKGVYLALLAAGPLLFPFVRRNPRPRIVLAAGAITMLFGLACTCVLVASRNLVGAVLGRAAASPEDLALLGIAMSLAGVTGLAISAGIARGVKRPWPPLALGIAVILVSLFVHLTATGLAALVLASLGLTTVICMANSLRHPTGSVPVEGTDPVLEQLAEAGDPLAAAQVLSTLEANAAAEAPAPAVRTSPTVAIVVPTFRRQLMLESLIDSLLAGTVVPDEIVIVDNDPTASVVPDSLPTLARVLHGGFGLNVTAARNLGWRSTASDVVIFVDDDNEVDARFVETLRDACADDRIGLAGPIIYSGNDGIIWCAGLRQSRWTGITRCLSKGMTEPEDTNPRWPTSASPDAFALRRRVLERVGGLDEVTFPMCGEEYDLAERVGALGLERVVVREAKVNHFGNVSENPGEWLVSSTMQHGSDRARFMARSRVRVHRLHSHGLPRYTTLLVFVPLWAIVSIATCLRAKAPLGVKVTTIRAITGGLTEGYREQQPPLLTATAH